MVEKSINFMLAMNENITTPERVESVYLKSKIRQMSIQMMKNHITIKYVSPPFDFKEAQELIRKIRESKIGVRETNRIKSKIAKLKEKGKI